MQNKSYVLTCLILVSILSGSCGQPSVNDNRHAATNESPNLNTSDVLATAAPDEKDGPISIAALVIPPNSTMVLPDTAYAFDELVMNDKSVIKFTASKVEVTAQKLTLHGRSTIDLRTVQPSPGKPPTPGGKGQAHNNPAPQNGEGGTPGQAGGDGPSTTSLKFSAQQLTATDGSLWIWNDGAPGGPGGDGGDGGKGSSGPSTCVSNPDGGHGGAGGAGGAGGKGGPTAGVSFKIGPNTIKPTETGGTAPTTRPAAADIPGTIVIAGAPGRGGAGGQGGRGGPGGEGHEGPGGFFCPSTDSRSGNNGANGAVGAEGPKGIFSPPPA